MSWQNPFDLGKNCIHHDQWGSEQTRCKFYHNKQPFRILSYLNRRQLKSSRYSFVMRRDTHSKSSSIHLLSPKHCQIISLSSDQGNAYVTMRYIDEKAFRLQTKHILKKLTAVTKRLRDLKEGATPYMKLTYYEGLTHSVFFFWYGSKFSKRWVRPIYRVKFWVYFTFRRILFKFWKLWKKKF